MQQVPLTVLAGELGEALEDLAQRVGDQISTDPASGVRVLPANLCRQLITEHQQQLAALAQVERAQDERQRAESARQSAQYAAAQKVAQRRAQRQRALLADNPGMSALELMLCCDDPDPNNRRTPASVAFDEIVAANNRGDVGVYHKLSPAND